VAARSKRAMVAERSRAPSRRVYVAEGSDTPRHRRVWLRINEHNAPMSAERSDGEIITRGGGGLVA
jgi:hypothetical protein